MPDPLIIGAPVVDYSQKRGCATEPHWDIFVARNGGVRLTDQFPNPTFPNADYLFYKQKIIIELKIIETEFGNQLKFENAFKKFVQAFLIYGERGIPTLSAYKRVCKLLHRPLAAMAKKANLQIRQTKTFLNLEDWSGLLLCVNDNFRKVPPKTVMATVASALKGSMSSIDGFIYLTNHFVDMPDNPYANLIWAPVYSKPDDSALPDFVNWLGRRWFEYCEEILGEFAGHIESDDITLDGAAPVSGPFRFVDTQKGQALLDLPLIEGWPRQNRG